MHSDALLPAESQRTHIFLSYDRDRVLNLDFIKTLQTHLDESLGITVERYGVGSTGTGLGPRSNPPFGHVTNSAFVHVYTYDVIVM